MNEANPIVVFVYSEETKDAAVPPNVTHVKVDPSVKEIREKAFFGLTSLVDVEFSEGRLDVIGIHAFAECRKLMHMNQLPSTLKAIGSHAFFECSCLETLVLSHGLRKIGSSAFSGCRKLKEIEILSSSISIEDRVFAQCHSLTSIELPEGLKIIGECLFKGCSALVDIEIPSSVIEIHRHAFLYCTNLASVHFMEGLEEIGEWAFKGCESIQNVHLPATLNKVGSGIFHQCERLESCKFSEGLTMIGDIMFSGCSSLTLVAIPESVKSIGEHAFNSCTSLQRMRIPSTVVSVRPFAFWGCERLKLVNIESDCLTIIRHSVFEECVSLTHLRLPSSITEIEHDAFSRCNELISLEFPKELRNICIIQDGDDARLILSFAGCTSLVNLVVPASQQVVLDSELELLNDRNIMDEELRALAHISPEFDKLVPIMQHRFDNKPVHELCYYHSYYSLEETRQNLVQATHKDPLTVLDVDAFGMTPFHILSLSQTPMLPLFEALLDRHDVAITALGKDKFGNSPMDYLCMNDTAECTAVIRSLLQKDISKQTQLLLLDPWRNRIMAVVDEAMASELSVRRQEIELLRVKVAEFERMEVVSSLLELAIWKMKIKDVASVPLALGGVADRESCRFNNGAAVIIPNTLLFLNKVWPVPVPVKRRRLDI